VLGEVTLSPVTFARAWCMIVVMTANYRTQTKRQCKRRAILNRIRDTMGDTLFASFIVDTFSEHGAMVSDNFAALASLWLRYKAEALAEDSPQEAMPSPPDRGKGATGSPT
jgi:hypothetical protein